MFSFELHHTDAHTDARRGVFHTPRGRVDTPAFMPVGTQGTVKGLLPALVKDTGAQMILANTYHLALRPGEEIVAELGELHQFSQWSGPILTDSGGFQIFSLSQLTKVTEEAATFRAHTDGRLMKFSPERAVEIQETLGSDVAMVLDHVVALPNPPEVIQDACDRSVRWAQRCRDAHTRANQAQFAIVQGGLDSQLRVSCAEQLAKIGFEGYAIGGLSVGEAPADMYRMLDVTCPALPTGLPRYLMGVGRPQDILQAIRRGVDLFDCVMPTRNGRNALAFTDTGPLRLRNQIHQRDLRPIDPNCPCPACQHSRGYLRHLVMAREMLGPILLSAHNLTYYQKIVSEARLAIESDNFANYAEKRLSGWGER